MNSTDSITSSELERKTVTNEIFLPRGRSVPMINGAKWIDRGIKMVAQQPKVWMAISATIILVSISSHLLSKVDSVLDNMALLTLSIIATIAAYFITYGLLPAGAMCVAESQRLTGKANFKLFSQGFSQRTGEIIALLLLQWLMIVATIIIIVIWFTTSLFLHFESLADAFLMEDAQQITSIINTVGIGQIILALLVMILGLTIIGMLTWFAIPLIMLKRELSIFQAMAASFWGCLKNIPAFIISVIALTVLLLILAIIFTTVFFALNMLGFFAMLLLGFVFGLPILLFATSCLCVFMYTAYRDIFFEESK